MEYKVKEKAKPVYISHEGNDTLVVLMHGFTGSPYDVKELAEHLNDRGVDTYSVRIAGHGTNVNDLIQTDYIDWLTSVEDALRPIEEKYRRIFLVGYSFGGNLALALAAKYPDKFSGIICIGASVYLRMSKPLQFYLHYMNYAMRFFGKHTWKKPYVPKEKVDAWEATGGYAYLPLKSMLDWKKFIDTNTKESVKKINVPILLMHSRGDRVTHPQSADYIFENIKSKYKELYILPELNHNPLRSESKDIIFKKVLEFIEG